MFTFQLVQEVQNHEPWNKGKLVGQRRPLKLSRRETKSISLIVDDDVMWGKDRGIVPGA